MLTDAASDTALVVTWKVVDVDPAGTVAVGGTCAAEVLLLASAMVAPPRGATAFRVMVAIEDWPPRTLLGFNDTDVIEAGFTVSDAVLLTLSYEAVIVDVADAPTALVLTVNEAVVAPARTVTEAGTVATEVLLLERVTIVPPAGAALVSVTVPLDELPPVTAVGLRATSCNAAGGAFTVNVFD